MPRFRPHFSLLTAFLLLTIVGLSIVVVQLWHEVGPLRLEVGQLRTEQGLLVIEEKSKVDTIQLPATVGDGRIWTYRVYVPQDSRCRVILALNKIPGTGLPNVRRSAGSTILGCYGNTTYADLGHGELLLTVRLFEDDSGVPYLGFQRRGPGATPLTDIRKYSDDEWPHRETRHVISSVSGRTKQADEQGVVVLVRFREVHVGSDEEIHTYTTSAPDNFPANGFMMWIEPLELPLVPAK